MVPGLGCTRHSAHKSEQPQDLPEAGGKPRALLAQNCGSRREDSWMQTIHLLPATSPFMALARGGTGVFCPRLPVKLSTQTGNGQTAGDRRSLTTTPAAPAPASGDSAENCPFLTVCARSSWGRAEPPHSYPGFLTGGWLLTPPGRQLPGRGRPAASPCSTGIRRRISGISWFVPFP